MSTEAQEPTAAEVYAKALIAFVAEFRGINLKPTTIQHKLDGVMYTSSKLPARVGLA